MVRDMKETYSIKIERAGMADLPELVATEDAVKAAAVVQYLLACQDPRVMAIIVSIVRV